MLGRATVPTSELDRTAFAHPALFVTEYALAQLWKEWGVEPTALLGYSLGEYAAACLAGVFSLEDALRIVALRAQAIERLPAGAMLAVPLPEAEVLPLLGNDLALAAVNGPEISVVGGPVEAVQALEERLAERGLAMRRLRTSHAFHSPMMQPVANELARLLAGMKLQAPRIPFLSNVTGTWIEPDQAVDPLYWTRHLLAPVRLADGLAELWAERDRMLLEVGPGGGLSSLALQHPSAGGHRVAVPSLPGSHETRPDQAFALGALGRLWLSGAAMRWDGFWQREERCRLRLPTYPFERRRYWVEQKIEERPAGSWAPQQETAPRTMQDTAVSTTRHSRPALPTPFAAPVGAVEEGLAAIWQELLGVEPIGRHDSFFDLGGHSLLASQLMTRLAERFGAEIPLSALFEAPVIAKLAETVQAAQTEPGTRTPPIVPVERPEEGLPLSFAQERLWFLDRLIPDNPVYHVPLVTRLRGRLLWPVLAASLNEIARRHEVMRTTFTCVDDLPRQVAAPELRLDPPVVDLSALPAARREGVARRLLDVEMARPFDLARGPLVRALLVRLDLEEHLTLVNLHHIVADGWSLGVLVQELGALYRAFAASQPSPLPPLPVQYADYAVWQRQWLQGERLEEQIAYWRERLAGAPAVLDLPHDRPRPPIQRFQGAKLPFWLGAEALPGLSGLQRGSQVTLFMVLLAGYQTLLSRLSGQDDLIVGSPVAGRGRREVEGLIGFFINTLALRADLSGDPTFGDLLAQVRQVTLEAYAREDLPFERLVGELQTERSLAHSPIYQAVLVLLNTPSSTLELPGVSLEMIDTWVEGTKWDLTISLEERADGLAGYWEYDSDLFDATTVARFAGQFRELLRTAVAEPERRLSQLPGLTEPERHQLLREWNPGDIRDAPEACLHGRFDAGVPRWSGEIAVSWDEGSWTYRELAERAGRLAHHLRGMGVGPEVPVALCLERSPETVVSILAVLEAGGAYVPIDPHYPRERQEWVLEDSGAKVLLTTRAVAPEGPRNVLFLDDLDLAAGPILPPGSSGAGPDNLAYIMYTSGSTGRPKGVMVTHRNLVRLFTATEEQFHFRPGDALTLFHSYAFDVSVWELWGALLHGGRAVVVPHWVSRSPEVFHELLRTQRVTVLNQTPQAFRQLALVDPELEQISSLRAVIFAGEALDFASLTPWWQRYGAERPLLINMHGITETTVFDTYRAVLPADVEKGGSLIGRALSDVVLRVLDRRQQPVAAGVPGELCIGGPGLVRGYLGRPDLTAERFIPGPFSGEPGARLYRTGDLVRYRPDGDMDFLGRIDHQVKIRGYRIELGEIESVLANHPAVAQAVVLARQDAGDKRLVAYVVAAGVEDSELREHCRRHLPEPMVPALFVLLESLPLSPTGKVDRRALAARPIERAVSAASYKAPADELENLIAEIWQEVLSIERVGVDDNFFDLGGHSLALVQVQRKIKARLTRDVSVVDLFRTPTVAALAKYLTDTTTAGIAASTDAAHEGDERAQRRRALRERRRSSVESETSEVYEHVD
jgi:amino acid adenylation domain-containing protein